jgi:hypothetical protein
MNIRINATLAWVVGFALLINIPTGCGNSSDGRLSIQNIPRYPNAATGKSMAQSSPGGLVGGKLEQFTTTDSFDEVVEFYTDALTGFEPKFISHTSELGRQTAISIRKQNGVLSVAIQAFPGEGKVSITLMSVGK